MNADTQGDADLADALRMLVLREYADGNTIEGTQLIESVPDEIPNWEVTISRVDTETGNGTADSTAEK